MATSEVYFEHWRRYFVGKRHVLLLGVLAVSSALAQTDRGTITGTITDSSGAVIPGAAVHARNTGTGAEYETVATSTGNYTLPSLPAGTYDLTVTANGFSTYNQHGIGVEVVQTLRVDVALQVGSASESVTVTADAGLLRTENAEISHNLSTERVDALPNSTTNVRDPFAFASIMPGVVGGTTAPAGSANIKVNGSPATAYKVLLDGQDITNTNQDPSHTLEQQPAVEALQEFTLQASNFSAEFGQITGGLFNLTTKSGTNGLHGVAFVFVRNEDLGAGKPYSSSGNGHLLRPRVRGRNYGGAIGGPVVIPKLYNGRNKTFFFANLELYRNYSGTDTFVTMPTVAMKNGDFSQALTGRTLGSNPAGGSIMENMIFDPLSEQTVNGQLTRTPFPNNVIPTNRLDPVALKIQSWFPDPTRAGLVNNWEQRFVSPEKRHIPSVKIDHNIGEKSKLSFYASDYLYFSYARMDGLPTPITSERNRKIYADTYQLHYDYTATPTLVLHAGFGYVRSVHNDNYMPESLAFDPKTIGLNGSYTTGFPTISGIGNTTQGGFSTTYGIGVGAPVVNYQNKPSGVFSATKVHANHTYKAGVQWRKDPAVNKNSIAAPTYNFSANQTALPYLQTTNIGGATIGLPYASFVLGMVNTASVPPTQDPGYTKASLALYVQDTWKITRKLTLDYGLRWDYQQAPEEMHNRASMFAPTVPNPTAGGLLGATIFEGYGQGRCNCQFTTTYPYAIGPRIGVAYQFTPRTVVRAGWGISYGTTADGAGPGAVGVGWNTLSFSNTAFAEPATTLAQGLSYNLADVFAVNLDPGIRPQPGQINNPPAFMDRNAGRPPRINQWNIALQREITKDIAIEAAYVGNRGVWMQSSSYWDLNALTPQRIAAFGLDINNANDRTLLTSTLSSSLAASRGFNKPPYPGFPTSLTVAQSLRPYPQFGSLLEMWAPLGNTWYDALQVKATKRTSHGLYITVAYTRSKTMDIEAENYNGGGVVNDQFNRANLKALSAQDLPNVFSISYNYVIPKIGPNRILRAIAGGWTLSGVMAYQSGALIPVPSAQNNLSTLLFRSTLANRVPGQPLFLTDPNGHIDPNAQFLLNPKAWSDPAAGQWGYSAPYYNDYRGRRTPNETGGLGRIFHVREGMNLEIRGEWFNIFNRIGVPSPTATNALATQVVNSAGVPQSGFGYMNSASPGGSRSGQVVARFQF
jgi:hypothetical protein